MTLSRTTKILHSIIAISMIGMLAVGIYMEETETYWLYDWHKSIGVIVLVVALLRIIWRIKKGWPTPVGNNPQLQLMVAKAVHWILILSTVIYPVSGMMMSGGGGHGIAVFGITLMAENPDPATGNAVPVNEAVASLGHEIHGLFAWILVGIIVLHIVGALKHHFIDKDETIKRMFS